jgi:hypothetical protein
VAHSEKELATSICFQHCLRQLPEASRTRTYVQRHNRTLGTLTRDQNPPNLSTPTASGRSRYSRVRPHRGWSMLAETVPRPYIAFAAPPFAI